VVEPGREEPTEPHADQVDDERVVVAGLEEADLRADALGEASEADVVDQSRPVAPRAVHHAPHRDVEASEADLLDQAREVPLDEDLDR